MLSKVGYVLIVIGVILLIVGLIPTGPFHGGYYGWGGGLALILIGVVLLVLPVPV